MPCFKGEYIGNNESTTKEEVELNVYELMVMGLKIGLNYNDFYQMNLVTLINLLTTAYMKKEVKPTQQQIDLIT